MLRSTRKAILSIPLAIYLTLMASPAFAADGTAVARNNGLHPLDWTLLILYAVGTLAIGFYYGRNQETTKEYFVGSGRMNPILVGVSLFATLLSTISYLSLPGESAGKGPMVLCSIFALPFVYALVAYVMIPVYMKHRVTSAYELLEERLGLGLRLLGATMFLALRLVWMTLLIYLAAKAMLQMIGLGPEWLLLVVAVTGAISIIYTTIGGMRAVVITDFMQTCLLFGGALLVILSVTIKFGGFGWFPTQWQTDVWDPQPVFSWELKTRVTVVGSIISVFVWYVATLGGDQTTVQRFMATEDVSAARVALKTQLITAVIVQLTLALVGFALLAYFTKYPEFLSNGLTVKDDADRLFPEFIAFHLPIGVAGLVVAAMFAAAMSSIDSGVNSITAVVMKDFLERFGLGPKTKRGHMITARALALTIGIIVVASSTSMKYIEGNITTVTGKTVNLLAGPIFSLFFFALFVPRAHSRGVWLGVISGILVSVCIAFSGPLVYRLHADYQVDTEKSFNVAVIEKTDDITGEKWMTCEDPVSFQWIAPFGLATCIVVGYLGCLVIPAPPARSLEAKPTPRSKFAD
jgi:SSS family solute:Na+ symporter